MRFAAYGRKSVFSDKSDSIDNQLHMAKDYAEMHFPGQVESFTVYSDEDFSGANTNRPDLQRLVADIKAGFVDALIVYQLDRLSRDVRDFSNLYSVMEEKHVNFISLKENIDTTTPLGKAMMYVSVVFAQMERETTAARVTDNMRGLAKKGYWVGGKPPHGFTKERITCDGKNHVILVPDPEASEYILNIINLFLDGNYSIITLGTYFKNNKIRTPSGAFFSTNQIHKILTMPYCVEATPEIYDFYAAKGCCMDPDSPREKWTGEFGVMVYGRTTEINGKHQLAPPEKWIVCIGKHRPFLSADKFLRVQQRLSRNKFDKTMKYDVPLLKGILRCSCGSIMCVSRKKKPSGGVSSWYYCLKRTRQGSDYCDAHHIKIDFLDEKVLEIFRSIEADPDMIMNYVSSVPIIKTDADTINKKITSCETKIRRLAGSLAINEDSTASKYIIAEMELLDKELAELKRELLNATYQQQQNNLVIQSASVRAEEIGNLIRSFDSFTSIERNEIVKKVVTSCTWDGETLSLVL